MCMVTTRRWFLCTNITSMGVRLRGEQLMAENGLRRGNVEFDIRWTEK